MSGPGGTTECLTPGMIAHKPSATFLYAGLIFLFAALALFLVAGFSLYEIAQRVGEGLRIGVGGAATDVTKKEIYNFYGEILSIFLPPLLLVICAGVCSFIGIRLLRSAGAVTREVIPTGEYALLAQAISNGNEKAISEYIRLSSLSGMTGTFTKIGLTGLPFATIVLTILLSILGLFNPKFFDLAQLTLGAFIGSYVQKKREEPSSPVAVAKS